MELAIALTLLLVTAAQLWGAALNWASLHSLAMICRQLRRTIPERIMLEGIASNDIQKLEEKYNGTT